MPEAAKAAKEQLLFERGLALGRMEYAMKVGLGKKKFTPEELGQIMTPRLPMLQHMVDVLTQWQKEMPDQAKALDEVLSAFNLGIAGNWAAYLGDARLTIGRTRPSSFGKAVEAVCRIRQDNNWQGSVSDVMACPVSDGEIVAVTLGFGQVAAYELATGKGVVYLFKPSPVADTITINLRGVDPARRYRVSFEDGSNPAVEKTGDELAKGLEITLKGAPVSELVWIEEINQ